MSYETAVAAIVKYFAEQWDDLTPVAYPDVAFDIPDGQTWARLIITHALGYQASTGAPGNNKFRREGLVTVQVFTPEGKAGQDALQKADLAVSIFQAKPRIQGIAFEEVRVNEIGNFAGWYQINVKADFQYDTIA